MVVSTYMMIVLSLVTNDTVNHVILLKPTQVQYVPASTKFHLNHNKMLLKPKSQFFKNKTIEN